MSEGNVFENMRDSAKYQPMKTIQNGVAYFTLSL